MIDTYNRCLNEYIKDKGNLTCYPYLLVFVNFASTSNTPLDELQSLHEKYKHQMGRSYSQEYRLKCRRECGKFIQFILDNHEKLVKNEKHEKKKKTIKIFNTIRGIKK